MAKVTAAIVGASGETGRSIVNGLLHDPDTDFEITALIRPQSLQKPFNIKPQERGVRVMAADLNGPQEALVNLLSGIDVVIAAIFFGSLADERPLAEASKKAGVKRFLQSAFMIVIPSRGVVVFREQKENNLNFIQKIRLPYTYVDAGWWYQITLPRLPSGRLDYVLPISQPENSIGLDGNVSSALADIRDVGCYAAKIITDPRTLNKRVHVRNEVLTRNQVYEAIENLAGEQLPRSYVSEDQVLARIENARSKVKQNPSDLSAVGTLSTSQLFYSWGIRGDNTPETRNTWVTSMARSFTRICEFIKFEDYVKEVLDGKAVGVYQGN